MEEDNRQAGEEEKTVGEAYNSAKESRALKEDEEIPVASVEQVDPQNLTEKSSTDLSNLRTDDSNHLDVSDAVMKEEEKIVEFPNYTSSVTPETAQQKNIQSLNKSEGMLLQVPEHSMAETEETNEVIHILDNNEFAGSDTATMKSSSASNPAGDSSGDSDPDSKYLFDEPQPVSADVEEPENLQDEAPESKNEIQVCDSTQKKELKTCSCMKNAVTVSNLINTSMTFQRLLLSPKQHMLQPTSWKNCCGLLELLRSSDP